MRKEISKILVLVGMIPLAASVQALTFQPTDEVKVSVDTILSYGAQWRMDAPDKRILRGVADPSLNIDEAYEWIQRSNADDASRNFDKGDQTSNRYGIVTDIDMSYKNVGFFTRLQAHYDSVYFQETNWQGDNNTIYNSSLYPLPPDAGSYESQFTNNELSAGNINSVDHFGEHAKDAASNYGLLDAYAYGAFDIDGHSLNVRVGRQVISWGEALILQGGIGFAQNRIDAQALTSPGAELKEGFLPTGSVFAQLGLTDSLTLEAYWMYEFIPSTLTATGSFFSSQDFIEGGGGDAFLTHSPTGDCPATGCRPDSLGNRYTRLHDDWLPQHEANQWGIALRKLLDDGSELGFYYLNYHDKYPMFYAGCSAEGCEENYQTILANGDPLQDYAYYQIRYMDDIRLYGLTYATVIGDVQMGFELSYRANAPIVTGCTKVSIASGGCDDPSYLSDPANAASIGEETTLYAWPERAEVVNWNMGATYIFNPSPLWDTATLAAELGGWYIMGVENHQLKNAWLGGFTQYGQGVSGVFRPEYKNVLEGLDIVLPFFFKYTIDGSFAVANYTEHDLWLSWGVEARYLANWDFSLIYSDFSGKNNLWGDRDNIAFTAKYSF